MGAMTEAEFEEFQRARRMELLHLVPQFLSQGMDPLQGFAYDEEFGWRSKGVEEPSKYEYQQLADDIAAIIRQHLDNGGGLVDA